MNAKQREYIKALIKYYDRRGWDWSDVLEFQVRRFQHSLPWTWFHPEKEASHVR